MNKVKEIISENRILILMLIVIIAISVAFFVIDYIDGKKIYESGLNNADTVQYIEKKYGDNEYKAMVIEEVDIVQNYYKDYLNKMLNSPKEAWNITFQKGENKSTNFNENYDSYEKQIKKRITKTTSLNKVEKYSYKRDTNYNIITVIDSENYMYDIYEYGVWVYKIAFRGQVRD